MAVDRVRYAQGRAAAGPFDRDAEASRLCSGDVLSCLLPRDKRLVVLLSFAAGEPGALDGEAFAEALSVAMEAACEARMAGPTTDAEEALAAQRVIGMLTALTLTKNRPEHASRLPNFNFLLQTIAELADSRVAELDVRHWHALSMDDRRRHLPPGCDAADVSDADLETVHSRAARLIGYFDLSPASTPATSRQSSATASESPRSPTGSPRV